MLDHVPNVLILSQDSFYRYHEQEEIDLAFANELDFDHPSAIDFGLFKEVLEELRLGNSVEVSLHVREARGGRERREGGGEVFKWESRMCHPFVAG